MKIQEILSEATQKLQNRGIQTPFLDSEILLSHALNINTKDLLLFDEKKFSQKQLATFNKLLDRRLQGEPVSHLIGKRGFWDFEFAVNKNTLDPRPDSETLIEAVLETYKDKNQKLKILDLGTGTGCLIITLLKLFPNASGVATDISSNALKIARKNAEALGAQTRLVLKKNNWNDNLNEQFDIIISNPPYIPTKTIQTLQTEVKNFEPLLALDGGKDGLDCYRYLAKNLRKSLADDGLVFLEIGQGQKNDVVSIFEQNSFVFKFVKKDFGGINRVLCFTKNKTR